MQLKFSYRYLFLTLLVISSHLALMTHVFSHASPEIANCELCFSQDHQSDAMLPAVITAAASDLVHAHDFLVLSSLHAHSCVHNYQQRAPPVNA